MINDTPKMLARALGTALLSAGDEELRQDIIRAAVYDMSISNAAEVLSLALNTEHYITHNDVLRILQIGTPASPHATALLMAAGWPIDD